MDKFYTKEDLIDVINCLSGNMTKTKLAKMKGLASPSRCEAYIEKVLRYQVKYLKFIYLGDELVLGVTTNR